MNVIWIIELSYREPISDLLFTTPIYIIGPSDCTIWSVVCLCVSSRSLCENKFMFTCDLYPFGPEFTELNTRRESRSLLLYTKLMKFEG